jgi:hypothetical protein
MLPEGCADLYEAHKRRAESKEGHFRFILRIAAELHDPLVATLDPEVLRTRNPDLLLPRISDFLHPILLADPKLEKQIGATSDLVEMLYHVVMANLDD